MNFRKPFFLAGLLWWSLGLISVSTQAQIYPVTANITLIQPNSVYLSDYTTTNSENLRITLLQNDQINPTYDVKLHIKIEGSGIKVQTTQDFNSAPFTLTNGVPEVLYGADLAPYLDANALQFQGITKDQYRRRAAIPDGFYTVSVQVFDYRTGVALSQEATTSAWFVLNDPPRVNLPACGTKLRPQDPTYILFNWLGMQTGGGFSTEYTFQLFWIQPKGRNPNDFVLASATMPIYETTTNGPSIIYGPSEPPLFPGEQYAWRVQAKEAFGRDLFKNNGYSEVCWFTYGDACTPPTDVTSSVEGSQRASITWTAAPVTTQYLVQYREKGSDKWYSVTSVTEKVTITDFKPSTTYEYKVQSVCGVSYSEASPVDTLRTSDPFSNTTLSCGQPAPGQQIDSTQKLPSLKPGDQVKIGNFTLIISDASGSNGSFSGTGSMQISLLNTAVMGQFDNLKINSQYQAYAGVVNVRSGAMALLPPEIRDKVNSYYDQIVNTANQIDQGLGNAQDIIDKGTTILTQVNGIADQVKNTGLDDLKDNINDIKGIVKDGVSAVKDGDTTKGKNILANAVDALGDALGAAGNVASALNSNSAEDFIHAIYVEKRDTSNNQIGQALNDIKGYISDIASSEQAINTDQSDVIIGEGDTNDFEAADNLDGAEAFVLSSDDDALVVADTYHSSMKNKVLQTDAVLQKADKVAHILAYVNYSLDPQNYPAVLTTIMKTFKADLLQYLTKKISEIPDDKKIEIKQMVIEFIEAEAAKFTK